MYIIMSETFIKVWFTARPWNFKTNLAYEPKKKIRVYLQHSLFWCYANFSKLMPTIHTVWLAQRNESSWVWKETVVKVHKQGLFCKRHYPIERKKGRFSILIFISNSCNDQVSFIWKKKSQSTIYGFSSTLDWNGIRNDGLRENGKEKKTNNTLLYL